MKIAFTFNVKRSDPSLDPSKQKDTEFDAPETINQIKETLESLGHEVVLVEANENAFDTLQSLKGKIDLVFNIAEGLTGDARESQIPLFCEVLGIPYTHSGPTTNAIKLDKEFTKLIIKGAEIVDVPGSITFPLIVKPNKEGSSKGIMDNSVVRNKEELDKKIKELREALDTEVLVEEYIDGREFTVGVLGNKEIQVLPIIEQKFDFLPAGMNKIAGYELKWLYEDKLKDLKTAYDCPAKIDEKLKDKIEDVSKKIYKLLDVRDCARIDYRLSNDGTLYFIEINTLPGINPDMNQISYFPRAAMVAGMSYKDLISKIISLASERYELAK
ncbi:MAG: ATP-grasp domain-containing protein [Candidatus Microgenomates bacterium]|jgi:D-alanine-D-alanine ligase